jgi:hypothetical protein
VIFFKEVVLVIASSLWMSLFMAWTSLKSSNNLITMLCSSEVVPSTCVIGFAGKRLEGLFPLLDEASFVVAVLVSDVDVVAVLVSDVDVVAVLVSDVDVVAVAFTRVCPVPVSQTRPFGSVAIPPEIVVPLPRVKTPPEYLTSVPAHPATFPDGEGFV